MISLQETHCCTIYDPKRDMSVVSELILTVKDLNLVLSFFCFFLVCLLIDIIRSKRYSHGSNQWVSLEGINELLYHILSLSVRRMSLPTTGLNL